MKLKRKTVLLANAVVFTVVALAHALRVLFHIEITIGNRVLSMWVSVIGAIVIAYLAWNNYVHYIEHR
ncbi:hypothetical protein COV16_01180 [Candidatus Woesearchaeota archaeon CG10_big_fil_rev_8_21_14_0_10_34_8]|nr:MAG: hypothetical protein COV16_01180 [Candidatus Woesearchaeota archaeon CG10_big_fil_rev_8_21_14_0_10_34_8]